MKVIYEPRATGKTTRLLAWAMDDPANRAVLVADNKRADDLRFLSRARFRVRAENAFLVGDTNPQPFKEITVFTPDQREALRGTTRKAIAIDQADDVLRVLFGRNVEIITMTAERETL